MKLALGSLVQRPSLFGQGESALVSRAAEGDRRAFDDLSRRYAPDLRAFVRRRVAEAEVDDIMQETWISAWSALKGFDRRSRFKTWLIGIALNKCRDFYRQRGHGIEAPMAAIRAEPEYHETAFASAELGQAIGEVLRGLSDSQREVLELYYFSGFKLSEIANVLDRNLNTVKYQFYRAHADAAERLRELGLEGSLGR